MKNKIKKLLWKLKQSIFPVMPSEILRTHMEEFEEAWDIMKECELSEDTRLINIINVIYETEGFQGVIEEVQDRLEYGNVRKMNGLYRVSTGGWSEDEMLVDALISPMSRFHYHYVGYLVGGAFYFTEDKSFESISSIDIIKVE